MKSLLPGLSDVRVIKEPEEALVKNTYNGYNAKHMIIIYLHQQPKDKTVMITNVEVGNRKSCQSLHYAATTCQIDTSMPTS